MAEMMCAGSIWAGSGICTRIPCTEESAFNSRTRSISARSLGAVASTHTAHASRSGASILRTFSVCTSAGKLSKAAARA